MRVRGLNRLASQRFAGVDLAPHASQMVGSQRVNLAACELLHESAYSVAAQIRRAIDDTFVQGFRAVMLIGAALAVGSALTSLWLIRGRSR